MSYAELYKKMIELDNGQSSRLLAQEIGVNATTVARWRRYGLTERQRFHKLTPELETVAEELLLKGLPYRAVAEGLKLDPYRLAKRLPGRGWGSGSNPGGL